MDTTARNEVRRLVQQSRRAPTEPLQLRVPVEGSRITEITAPAAHIELTLETTDSEGEIVAWLNDWWWADVIQRWPTCSVTLIIAPTPGAATHPVVLHQMDMLRRVAPLWRLVACARACDLQSEESTAALAKSGYHEIRLLDDAVSAPVSPDPEVIGVAQLIAAIQSHGIRLQLPVPVLVRVPGSP